MWSALAAARVLTADLLLPDGGFLDPAQEPTMAARDPIINKASSSSGSPKNASAGRVKSISGGGANFSKNLDLKSGAPCPNNPYSKS